MDERGRRNKKHGYGGFRIPSDETLDRYLTELSPEASKKALLIKNISPKRVKIYANDLELLREIGHGNWQKGFYRALALAKVLHLRQNEIVRLKNLNPDRDVRASVIELLEAEERRREI